MTDIPGQTAGADVSAEPRRRPAYRSRLGETIAIRTVPAIVMGCGLCLIGFPTLVAGLVLYCSQSNPTVGIVLLCLTLTLTVVVIILTILIYCGVCANFGVDSPEESTANTSSRTDYVEGGTCIMSAEPPPCYNDVVGISQPGLYLIQTPVQPGLYAPPTGNAYIGATAQSAVNTGQGNTSAKSPLPPDNYPTKI